jgi:ribosomal protein L34E
MIQTSQYEALSLRLNGLDCAERALVIEETKKAVHAICEVCNISLAGFIIINDVALKHADACKAWLSGVNRARSDELHQIREARKRV